MRVNERGGVTKVFKNLITIGIMLRGHCNYKVSNITG